MATLLTPMKGTDAAASAAAVVALAVAAGVAGVVVTRWSYLSSSLSPCLREEFLTVLSTLPGQTT